MSARFTPGPWQILRSADNYPYQIADDTGDLVTRWGFLIKPASPMAEANAALIAAAPDLYEALRELFATLDPERPGSPGSTLEKARAAIAKAEGRQP